MDDLRPKGTVEIQCSKCGWWYWLDPLDPKLANLPYVCDPCERGEEVCLEKWADNDESA